MIKFIVLGLFFINLIGCQSLGLSSNKPEVDQNSLASLQPAALMTCLLYTSPRPRD